MDVQRNAKAEFYTKFSLSKFLRVIRRLTSKQRELVSNIGFGHLLGIKCDVLPRGLICYLVSKFDARSRTFNIPNGPSFILTASVIHKVLGTPIGGRHIGEKVDAALRELIASVTKCKGRYPTINELDNLMTPDLEGDLFKIVFGMYAITAFLCPSSYDAVSPDYLHIFREPDEIGTFDISAAVLEKLISSIEAYNDGLTTVLGGNLLSLLIFYLEFLDCSIVPFHLERKLPRVAVWTTEMVNDIEAMDCISWNNLSYGKLKIKDVCNTPFARNSTLTDVMANKSYDDLLHFVLSVCPVEHHKVVNEQLPIIIANMQKDIVESVQSVLFENIINVLKLLPLNQPSYHNEGSFKTRTGSCQSKTAQPCLFGELAPTDHFKLTNSKPSVQLFVGGTSDSENSEARLKLAASSDVTNSASYKNQPLKVEAPNVGNPAYCGQQVFKGELPEIFLLPVLPVPSDKVMQGLDEEACRNGCFPSMKSILDSIETIPLEDGFEIPPYNHSLLQSMYPQKVEFSYSEDTPAMVFDLLAYILEETAVEGKVRSLMTENICSAEERVEIFNELFMSSPSMVSSNEKKRASWMSTNDDAINCIALKKRARMMQMDFDNYSNVHKSAPVESFAGATSHDAGQPSGHAIIGNSIDNTTNLGSTEYQYTEEEFDIALVNLTIKAEQEYEARKLNSQAAAQATDISDDSDVRHQEMVSSFESTLLESEVFDDIVARIPKTAKAKTTHIVVMGSTWAEHRVFGLSMQVYGRVNKYVVNMLGKAVMVEDIEKKKLGILREGYWKRFFFECKIADLFPLESENPGTLSKYLSNGMLGFRLDTMDLVHLPLFTSGFYYLLVVNFKRKVFEVFLTNRKFHLVEHEATVAINNFKMAFRLAYKHSLINIDQMKTVFQSVCNSDRDGDSGIFMMKIICDYNRDKTFLFRPEHAKPIREILTYYMVAHPFNEKMPPETKRILKKHNVAYDHSTPGYYPWMHEQSESVYEDSSYFPTE